MSSPRSDGVRLNVLILYDHHALFTNTVLEYLDSFQLHSRHRIWYAHAAGDARCTTDLDRFDVVVVHYSIRLSLRDHLSRWFARALTQYAGLKVLFIQDEYDTTNIARDWIERLGIDVVYTCVPPASVPRVYPAERFPHVRFVPIITGYIPERLAHLHWGRPLAQRQNVIGYRGRPLPYWYGRLGQEKLLIGQRMRDICRSRSIPSDIEWEEERRIYGDAWYEFLGNCRATLGTESGSNLFDWDGKIRAGIEMAQWRNPGFTFEEAFEHYMKDRDGEITMNQVSPKLFEAVAVRTALVLFEGSYSSILQPGRHYIPLRKDFSNVDDVLEQLLDDSRIEELTRCAYDDIVASGKYSYASFVRAFDEVLVDERRTDSGRGLILPLNDGPALAGPCGGVLDGAPQWLRFTVRRVLPPPVRQFLKPVARKALALSRSASVRGARARGSRGAR
jgi:hypothetical protein